jgi:hypothetical protein
MRTYLFIMPNEAYPWGGSEPLWSSAAEKLARRGNEVRVSVKKWSAPVPQVEKLRTAGCCIMYRDNRIPPFLLGKFAKSFLLWSTGWPTYRLDAVALGKLIACFTEAGGSGKGLRFVVANLDIAGKAERVVCLLDSREYRVGD